MVGRTHIGAAFVVGVAVFVIALAPSCCEGLRLRGQWRPTSQFFHFVARFATEGKSRELGVNPLVGNAFGNITLAFISQSQNLSRRRRGEPPIPLGWITSTPRHDVISSNFSSSNFSSNDTTYIDTSTTSVTTTTMRTTTVNPLNSLNFRLLLLDHDLFNDVYTNRTLPHNIACKRMLSRYSQLAFDARCNVDGRLDLFRTVPCQIGTLCIEEDTPANVVPGHQFRFSFRDAQPRMWYFAFVACYRDTTRCDWRPSSVDPSLGDVILDYDIWLVNGNPMNGRDQTSALYFLARYQFSYELRDLLLLRLAGLGAYSVLFTLIILIVSKSTHALCRLLMAAAGFDAFGTLATTISTLSFSVDGEGAPGLIVFGDLLLSTGQSCLLLILMFLTRGWTVSSRVLRRPGACILIWTAYLLLNLACIGWLHTNAVSLPVISAGPMAPEWTTPPGFSIIALRLCALGFFALQLRETVLEEHSAVQLHFYHRFAASSLVWFVSWPAIVAVANCGVISPLDRPRVLVAFSIVTDAVALSTLLHIFRKSLNVPPHKVPILNLANPVTSTSASASKRPPSHSSGGSSIAIVETIYFSITGLAYRLVEIFRTLFPSSSSNQPVYSPLLSTNTESLGESIAMEEIIVTSNNRPETLEIKNEVKPQAQSQLPPSPPTVLAPPPTVLTTPLNEPVENPSESPSPDWFEVELFSASMNSNLSLADNPVNNRKSVSSGDGPLLPANLNQ